MRRYGISVVLLLSFILSGGTTDYSSQEKMDEWQALDISLRNAKSIKPAGGFVPDETTAVKIGEAAADAQFGAEKVTSERPFRARLMGSVWAVKGTLHPQGALGGTAVVKLSKSDGRILFMTHQH